MCVYRVWPRTQGIQVHEFNINNRIYQSVNQKGMNHLRLPLLGSKTVIQTARRPLFTCVLRCHTRSLEGRRSEPIQITQQREINIPSKPLVNANVHRFLNPGTCCKNEVYVSRALFRCLVEIQGTKVLVRYDCSIRKNGTKRIDKNINIIIFSLTFLVKNNR